MRWSQLFLHFLVALSVHKQSVKHPPDGIPTLFDFEGSRPQLDCHSRNSSVQSRLLLPLGVHLSTDCQTIVHGESESHQQQPNRAAVGRGPAGVRRGLAIDSFTSNPVTGVWYYRVDVSVYEQELLSTFIDESDSDDGSEGDRSSDVESPADIEQYSVLRRYNDFLVLYQQIRKVVTVSEGNASSLPPFPVKEFMSPTWAGLLWRVPSSKTVLEDRRVKFEALLLWIENHPTARNCPAFVGFLGKPPQTQDGYVSLKEYTSPDWLSSLQQVTQGVEGRKRRYSAGSSAIRSLLEQSNPEASGIRRKRLGAVMETTSPRFLGKRRSRSAHQNRRAEPPCKKLALPAAIAGSTAAQKLPKLNADQVSPAPSSCGKRKVAQVEGNTRKKQCVA